jgi:hypothetical protein
MVASLSPLAGGLRRDRVALPDLDEACTVFADAFLRAVAT